MWIGTLAFLVGAALIWLAFVNNWQQFIAVRVILGLLEASQYFFTAIAPFIKSKEYFCHQGRLFTEVLSSSRHP